jgi:hypothetical protein
MKKFKPLRVIFLIYIKYIHIANGFNVSLEAKKFISDHLE